MLYRWSNPMNKRGGTFYGKKWDKEFVELHRAEKPHRCNECNHTIPIDDLYYADTFIGVRKNWDGIIIRGRFTGLPIPDPRTKSKCWACWKKGGGVDLINRYKQDWMAKLQAEQNRLKPLVAKAISSNESRSVGEALKQESQ